MGLSIASQPPSTLNEKHYHTHKVFLFTNYILLGASTSCIFLTLSLRLVPSLAGFFPPSPLRESSRDVQLLLHPHQASRVDGTVLMVATVLTSIFQGSVSVLIFTRTSDFLGSLNSSVKEENGAMILKLAGALCATIFCLEWFVQTPMYFLKYYAYVEWDGSEMKSSSKVQHQVDDLRNWPWPLQV